MLPAVSTTMPSMPRSVPKSCSTFLAPTEPSGLSGEVRAVGPAAGIAILGRLARGRVVLHDPIPDVAEVDAAIRAVGGALGKGALAPDFLELGPLRHDLRLRRARQRETEQQG